MLLAAWTCKESVIIDDTQSFDSVSGWHGCGREMIPSRLYLLLKKFYNAQTLGRYILIEDKS